MKNFIELSCILIKDNALHNNALFLEVMFVLPDFALIIKIYFTHNRDTNNTLIQNMVIMYTMDMVLIMDIMDLVHTMDIMDIMDFTMLQEVVQDSINTDQDFE